MPNADGRRELPRRRNCGSPTSENPMYANFSELRYGEVRRIPILRTPVNKGMKMGQSLQGPWPVRLLTTNRAALEPTAGAFPASYYSRLHPPVELVLSG